MVEDDLVGKENAKEALETLDCHQALDATAASMIFWWVCSLQAGSRCYAVSEDLAGIAMAYGEMVKVPRPVLKLRTA